MKYPVLFFREFANAAPPLLISRDFFQVCTKMSTEQNKTKYFLRNDWYFLHFLKTDSNDFAATAPQAKSWSMMVYQWFEILYTLCIMKRSKGKLLLKPLIFIPIVLYFEIIFLLNLLDKIDIGLVVNTGYPFWALNTTFSNNPKMMHCGGG